MSERQTLKRTSHSPADKSSRRYKRWLALCASAAAVLFLLFVLGSAATYAYYGSRFVSPTELALNVPAGGAKIYDRNGKLLYQYVDDREGLRVPLGLDAISPNLLAATIATEDASFYTNNGVNTKGLLRAVWDNFNPLSGHFLDGSGGSSITEQLIKKVYFSPEQQVARTPTRKLTEVVYAIKLTDQYSKDQILTWYLNQISYGSVFNGVEAASRGYFDKPAKELTLPEAALLAGLPQSPANYLPAEHPEAALARRNDVLDLMAARGRIQIGPDRFVTVNKDEIEAAKLAPLGVTSAHSYPIEAPHFVLSYVQPEIEARFGKDALRHSGLSITTTLDLDLQNEANSLLEQQIQQFEDQSNSHNGAVTVIDPKTGEILVMVGSRDYFREDIQGAVNNALAPTSPGSTFKPIVYLASFIKQGLGPASLIDDSAVSFREADGSIFSPTNPLHDYHGLISLRLALGNSLNIPAFKLAQSTGVPDIVSFGKKVGITSLTGSYGPSIAIGGVDLSQLDMAYAYSVLASGGVMRGQTPVTPHRSGERTIDPIAVLKIADGNGKVLFDVSSQRKAAQVAPEQQTFLINSILSDPNAVCLTFGCGGLNIPGITAAVKTGTSEPFDPKGPNAGKIGDTWAFAYSPDVVVSVWAGNADRSPITNLLSTSIAFRTARDTMLAYFDGRKATAFSVPSGVTRGTVCQTSGQDSRGCLSTVVDYYVQGSQRVTNAGVADRRSLPTPTATRQTPTGRVTPEVKATPKSNDPKKDDKPNNPPGRNGSR